jgi:hypothetical protein
MREPIILERLRGAVPHLVESGAFSELHCCCTVHTQWEELVHLSLGGTWRDEASAHLAPLDFSVLAERLAAGTPFRRELSISALWRRYGRCSPETGVPWAMAWPFLILGRPAWRRFPRRHGREFSFGLYRAPDAPERTVPWRRERRPYPGPAWWACEAWRTDEDEPTRMWREFEKWKQDHG